LMNDEGQESPGTCSNPGVEYGDEGDQVARLGTRHSDAIANDRTVRPINPSSSIDLLRHNFRFRRFLTRSLDSRKDFDKVDSSMGEAVYNCDRALLLTDSPLRTTFSRTDHRAHFSPAVLPPSSRAIALRPD